MINEINGHLNYYKQINITDGSHVEALRIITICYTQMHIRDCLGKNIIGQF